MKHLHKIARYNVSDLRDQVLSHPELWDEHPFRTGLGPEFPFYKTSDIWVRYRSLEELTEPRKFAEPHFAVFYPAWEKLPALHGIVFDLMHRVQATHLGGILITKVPAGGTVKPHHDRGSWHAEFFDLKAYVAIQTNDDCSNYCEDERIVMKDGESWLFNNLVTHGLDNEGSTDRISAIICMSKQ